MTFLSGSFEDFNQLLRNWDVHRQSISSLVLFLAFLVFRWGSILAIRRWNAPSGEEKRRWIIQIKNISLIILAAGLFGIWATELRAFALSLVAVAAAVAISTKEIIQCFMGGFWKTSVRPFEIGDRIEIAGYRGEVIDQNFLSTTLLEIGPAREMNQLSGRQVVIPNSLFLSNAVYNQSLQQKYVLQPVRFVVYPGESWKELEKLLLDCANRECSSFLEGARHSMARLSLREGLDLPRVEPRVTFQYDDFGRLHATLRFPTPLDRVSRTEQAIVKSVLDARQTITI
jgi:small-conductance mechanosensitive channel